MCGFLPEPLFALRPAVRGAPRRRRIPAPAAAINNENATKSGCAPRMRRRIRPSQEEQHGGEQREPLEVVGPGEHEPNQQEEERDQTRKEVQSDRFETHGL